MLRGKGGGGRGPQARVHIMENELECLCDIEGQEGHLAAKFLKKYYS